MIKFVLTNDSRVLAVDENDNLLYYYHISERLHEIYRCRVIDPSVKEFILPKFPETTNIQYLREKLMSKLEHLNPRERDIFSNYLNGHVTIKKGCFEGFNNVKIIVPSNYPIKIEEDEYQQGCAFDFCTRITFDLPKNMDLFKITGFWSFENTHGEGHGHSWTLIADKRISDLGRFPTQGYEHTVYPNKHRYTVVHTQSDQENY